MKLSMLRTVFALLLAGALLATLMPAPSGAIVPPRNCGKIKADGSVWVYKGSTWQVKADALRCRRARRYAKRYIRTRDIPRAYKCRRGDRGSSLWAFCSATRYDPDRVIHIIKRRR